MYVSAYSRKVRREKRVHIVTWAVIRALSVVAKANKLVCYVRTAIPT